MEVERVQSIASLAKHADIIPSEFIRSEKEQPAATTAHGVVLEVPVIDLGGHSNDKEIVDRGIFQVVNHAISGEVISKLQKVNFSVCRKRRRRRLRKLLNLELKGTELLCRRRFEGKKCWVDHLFHKIRPPAPINYKFWPKNPPSDS